MARRTIFTGTFVHTPMPSSLTILSSAAIFVDEAGLIAHIDEDTTLPTARINGDLGAWSGAELVFSRGSHNEFFFPGFVDTHIHASQYPNAGIFGRSSLLDWLETYTFPLEASLADPEKSRRVYGRCIARTLANGTTTAAYYATCNVASTNILADLCLKAGQRAFVGRCNMDRNSPAYYRDSGAEEALRDTEATIRHCQKLDPERKLLCPIVTPRFAPSCSEELLNGLGSLARREGLPVQTHISENKDEVEWVKHLFPGADNYASVYDQAGLLTERTILAHAVHLTDEEVRLVKERGAGVSHCPVSNLALTSGCAKVKALMRAGVKVGLGSDVSGGYSASVLENVRQATLVSRIVAMVEGEEAKLSVAEALYLGTRGGAEVVGLGKRIGAFEVGLEWDAVLYGLGNVPTEDPEEEEEEAVVVEKEAPVLEEPMVEDAVVEDVVVKDAMVVDAVVVDAVVVDAVVVEQAVDVEMGEDDPAPEVKPSTINNDPKQKKKEKMHKTNGAGAAAPIEPEVEEIPVKRIDDGIVDGRVDVFGWETWEEKVAKWVYNGDERNTQAVWVAGVEVYRKGGMPRTWPLDLSA